MIKFLSEKFCLALVEWWFKNAQFQAKFAVCCTPKVCWISWGSIQWKLSFPAHHTQSGVIFSRSKLAFIECKQWERLVLCFAGVLQYFWFVQQMRSYSYIVYWWWSHESLKIEASQNRSHCLFLFIPVSFLTVDVKNFMNVNSKGVLNAFVGIFDALNLTECLPRL